MKIKFNSLYFRIMLSFTMLAMVVIVGIAFIFSNIYMKSLYEQLSVEQVKGLELVNKNIENLYKEMDQIFLNLQLDTAVTIFLNQHARDDVATNLARIHASNIRQINPYIHSIFLYSSYNNDYIYDGDPGFDVQGFLGKDPAFRKSEIGSRTIYLTKIQEADILRKGFLTDKTGAYIITMEYTDHTINGEQHTIIININNDLLIRDYLGKAGNLTIVADEKGNTLCHTDFDLIGSSIQNEPYFKTITSAGKRSGDVVFESGSGHTMVTYVKNDVTGWYVLNFGPYENLVKPIMDKRNALIMICTVVLILCTAAIFIVSKKLYHPIEKLTDVFKKSRFNSGGSESSEISLISRVYREMDQRMQLLEDMNKNNLTLMKEKFLRQILSQAEPDESTKPVPLSEFKMRIEFSNLILCVFKIDGYMNMSEKEKTVYQSVLFKSLPEFLTSDFRFEQISTLNDEIVVYMNFIDQKNNSFQMLIACLGRVKDSIAKTLGITISIGIGNAVNDIRECPRAYQKALEMLQQRFVLGYDRIIYPSYVDEHLTRSISFPNEIEEKMVNAVKLNHREAFQESLDNMVYVLKNLVYADAVQVFFQIILVCITTMDQIIHHENKKFSMHLGELSHIFKDMETLDQAKSWMLKIFDEYLHIIESIKHLKENKFYRVIEDSQHYIRRHYGDTSLSVESLAEVSGYTPNYFSKIFREITGVTAGEYIRHVRISQAKELLKASEWKINDVAEMCGFVNSSHFYAAFKKDVGLTPAAYREFAYAQKNI